METKAMKRTNKMKCTTNYLRILILGLTIFWLSGCSYGKYITQINFNEEATVDPEIGVVTTSTLGEPIITAGYGHYSKILEVISTFSNKDFTGGTMYISKGLYELIYSESKYDYYRPINRKQTYYLNVSGEERSEYYNSQIRLSSSNEISVILSNGLAMPGDYTNGLNYKLIDSMFIEKENSFQQTMLYLGKVGDVVKFSYREFTNDHIRASFTTEISYDLSESKIIGFKKFQAEIIEASNTQLKYKLISSF
jgi:hypothetical protein